MTEEQFWQKFIELKARIDDSLRDRAKFILQRSGAVDMAHWDDDYQLPKIILTDALRHLADRYAPCSGKGRRELKNLSHF